MSEVTTDTRPLLPMTRKVIIEVDYDDFDTYCEKVYGHNPETVASEEWGNYEQHSIGIDRQEPLDTYDQARFDKFKETGHSSYGITQLLLQDLVNRDYLPPAEYVIKIFW